MRPARLKSETETTNKLLPEDHGVHDWYRFVLSFPAHLVRTYIWKFGIGPTRTVLDPFCGTGTTVVECKKLGIRSVGVEANPMAQFAARVKADWNTDPEGLVEHARRIAKNTRRQLALQGVPDDPPDSPKPVEKGRRELRALSPEREKLLLKNSISPLPLHKTLVLLDHIDRRSGEGYASQERLALAKALVNPISNLHFGPEVGVRKQKPDASVVRPWLAELKGMADDLRVLGGRR